MKSHLVGVFYLDDKVFDPSWFKDILFKIKQKIARLSNPEELRASFEVSRCVWEKRTDVESCVLELYFGYVEL